MNNKDKKIIELEKDIEWYKIWHNKFKKQIEDLTTELETYRPTKLHGNGQCSCYRCEQKVGFNRHWTDWCYSYKGHTYCSDCLREILKEEKEVNNDKLGQFEDIMAYYDIKNLNELDYILNYYKAMKLEEEY